MLYRFFVFLGLLTFSSPAWAYIDPGTGSLILQGLIAAFATTAAAISLYWRRLKDMWRSLISLMSRTAPDRNR
jgi:hypothetical protein